MLRSPGQALAAPLQEEMEGRLGADLSEVRVHADRVARDSATAVGASAYTVGSHVVIGERGADKQSLAHELTHVIQQRSGPVAGIEVGGGLTISDPGDRFEREAEANASKVTSRAAPVGEFTSPQTRTGSAPGRIRVQRQVLRAGTDVPEDLVLSLAEHFKSGGLTQADLDALSDEVVRIMAARHTRSGNPADASESEALHMLAGGFEPLLFTALSRMLSLSGTGALSLPAAFSPLQLLEDMTRSRILMLHNEAYLRSRAGR